ncbi:hypothetical protein WN51_11837 [Melipona quadrifasciata]|uniref:Uncharacterized protein n=1 Tax=Melipona quadrifasciata TaxID=166423 RepID=A0A0N0BHI6_9HYME|nr:hypothetical protein WN51_11837 [Melipona quadrifasciata]
MNLYVRKKMLHLFGSDRVVCGVTQLQSVEKAFLYNFIVNSHARSPKHHADIGYICRNFLYVEITEITVDFYLFLLVVNFENFSKLKSSPELSHFKYNSKSFELMKPHGTLETPIISPFWKLLGQIYIPTTDDKVTFRIARLANILTFLAIAHHQSKREHPIWSQSAAGTLLSKLKTVSCVVTQSQQSAQTNPPASNLSVDVALVYRESQTVAKYSFLATLATKIIQSNHCLLVLRTLLTYFFPFLLPKQRKRLNRSIQQQPADEEDIKASAHYTGTLTKRYSRERYFETLSEAYGQSAYTCKSELQLLRIIFVPQRPVRRSFTSSKDIATGTIYYSTSDSLQCDIRKHSLEPYLSVPLSFCGRFFCEIDLLSSKNLSYEREIYPEQLLTELRQQMVLKSTQRELLAEFPVHVKVREVENEIVCCGMGGRRNDKSDAYINFVMIQQMRYLVKYIFTRNNVIRGQKPRKMYLRMKIHFYEGDTSYNF